MYPRHSLGQFVVVRGHFGRKTRMVSISKQRFSQVPDSIAGPLCFCTWILVNIYQIIDRIGQG